MKSRKQNKKLASRIRVRRVKNARRIFDRLQFVRLSVDARLCTVYVPMQLVHVDFESNRLLLLSDEFVRRDRATRETFDDERAQESLVTRNIEAFFVFYKSRSTSLSRALCRLPLAHLAIRSTGCRLYR